MAFMAFMALCTKLNLNYDINQGLRDLKKKLKLLGDPKSCIKNLEKEMAGLRAKMDDVNNQIVEEKREGKTPTNTVNQWLHEVKELEDQVAAIKQDFQSMSCFICNCFICNCLNQAGGKSSQTQRAGDRRVLTNRVSINRSVLKKLSMTNELMGRAATLNPIATDLRRLESGIKKLDEEMPRLRAKRDDIMNKIVEAELEGKIRTKEVSQWLVEVKTLENLVTGIKQDFQSISCFSCNNCFNQTGGMSNQTQQAGDQVTIRESTNCCCINRRATETLNKANKLMSQTDAVLDPIATYLRRPKSEFEKLEKEMTRLRDKRDDIKDLIDEAEHEGKVPTDKVNRWLRKVEALEGQVTDIKQDFQSISCFCCNCFNQTGGTSSQTQQAGNQVSIRESSTCCSIIPRILKKLGEVNELSIRAGALDPVTIVRPPKPTVMLPMSHRSPVGVKKYEEDIVGNIGGGEGDMIIGIYGMGGVGKTTILKSIQQHYLLKHTIFDRVIWVVASKDCQLKRLQMDIAKSLGLNTLQENDDERTCGNKLFSYLKDRNSLLLLDDIWEQVDLKRLGMAHSATERSQQQPPPRRVVVFTTRSETVCAQMKAEKKIRVKCLDPDQAWQLFEQNSDRDVLSSDAGIKFVAEELAKECAGLPLALVTVARAMLGKKSWEAWNDALHQIRDKHDWITIGLTADSLVMYKAFKLSYDSLENDSLRECLLCCALWPEDYKIDQFSELISCWIGCGLICEFNVINEAFAKGYSYLEALVATSLLEQCSSAMNYYLTNSYVKMHDVIRDMALMMVSGSEGNKRKWIVKAGIGLSDLPRQEEWQEAERASFMSNDITSLQEYEASTFPKLSMLILCRNTRLKTIPPSLFASMPHLTYLYLSSCRITDLPMEIGNLTELQYLDLSNNPITRLPIEFGCLGKLEYLFLNNTKIMTVPYGTISNLSMLKLLNIDIYNATDYWWDELKCFKGCHQLSVAITIKATTDDIERLNMLPTNVSIWALALEGKNISKLPNYDLATPHWGYMVSDKLEFLTIEHLELDRLMLATGVGRKSSFGCLKRICFYDLPLLEEISLNEVQFYHLREIFINDCPMLEDVSWVLQLPCLSIVQIQVCPKMKKLINDVGNSNSNFNIQRLGLFNMENLNGIANRPLNFPYMEYIFVERCPKLKNLPFGTEILKNKLKFIVGDSKYWWDHQLDWDDERVKDSLTPYFRTLTVPTKYYKDSRLLRDN